MASPILGFTDPLYVLPFDHRGSFQEGLFGVKGAPTAEQTARVAESKQVVYDGFKAAIDVGVPRDRAGILVDEQFGAAILRDAAANGFTTAMPAEKSGQAEFDFEYGAEYQRHIEAFDPTFCKVLVRYNPEGDPDLNARQAEKLAALSDYLRRTNRLYMFELLVPAEPAQLDALGGDKRAFDLDLRPGLMVAAIEELQERGVEPDVWKIEGLDRAEECRRVVAAARRGGRDTVGCIVLGRGADETQVRHWLETAAGVDGFVGFAVGRTSFWDALKGWLAGSLSREHAVAQIAANYRTWVTIFERARQK